MTLVVLSHSCTARLSTNYLIASTLPDQTNMAKKSRGPCLSFTGVWHLDTFSWQKETRFRALPEVCLTTGKSNPSAVLRSIILTRNSLAYFNAARSLVDLTNCLDLSSLQAVLFIVMYLQCSGRLSECHSYLSIAIAASLRMGIHRSAASKGLDPIEQESRKRVFWALQTMNSYVSSMLGLPKALGDEGIDQDLPLEIHDKNIRRDGIRLGSDTQTSNMTAVNAHTRLMIIMSNIVNHLFSIKNGVPGEKGYYRVDFAKIIKVENELDEWFNSLAGEINPNGPDPLIQIRFVNFIEAIYLRTC